MEPNIYREKKTKTGLFYHLPNPELLFIESQRLSDVIFTYEFSNFNLSPSKTELLFDDDFYNSMAQL